MIVSTAKREKKMEAISSFKVYNAYLTSDLTILKTKNLISKTNDIKNGKIQFQRIGIRSD